MTELAVLYLVLLTSSTLAHTLRVTVTDKIYHYSISFLSHIESDDWNSVVIQCKHLRPMWKEVGLYLGLPYSFLHEISDKYRGDSSDWLGEVLKYWIDQRYPIEKFGYPSWKTLILAIASIDKDLSHHLAANHQRKGMFHLGIVIILYSASRQKSSVF